VIIGWFFIGNIAGLLTPLLDLLHRLFHLAPLSQSLLHLQMMLGSVFGTWIGMLCFCYSPNSKPKLFICVALVCTLCGLCLNVLLSIIAGQMAGLFTIPRLSSFADFSAVLEK